MSETTDLRPKTVTFKRPGPGYDWKGASAAVCDAGVLHHNNIPNNCLELRATFTRLKPRSAPAPHQSHFKLVGSRVDNHVVLKTDDDEKIEAVGWSSAAAHLMNKMHTAGYRHLTVVPVDPNPPAESAPPEEPRVITFRRAHGSGDFKAPGVAGVCADGVRHEIGIPINCREFDAIFTKEEPEGDDHFEIKVGSSLRDGVQLDTEVQMAYYDHARNLMKHMYEDGYRYLRVEY